MCSEDYRHHDHSHSARRRAFIFAVPSNQIRNNVLPLIVFCFQLLHIACKRRYNLRCIPPSTLHPTNPHTTLIIYIHPSRLYLRILWLWIGNYHIRIAQIPQYSALSTGIWCSRSRTFFFFTAQATFGRNFSRMSIMSVAMWWHFSFIGQLRIYFHFIRLDVVVSHKFLGQHTNAHTNNVARYAYQAALHSHTASTDGA